MSRLFLTVSLFIGVSFISSLGFAADVPGGLLRTAEPVSVNTYEVMMAPSFTGRGDESEPGMFLTTEFRYQVFTPLNVGFGLGAGQTGFNFGANASWNVLPAVEFTPQLSVLGGLYFNQRGNRDYFVVKFTPIVSQTFFTEWGDVTPYAGLQLTPSFLLDQLTQVEQAAGVETSVLSVRTSLGAQFGFRNLQGFRLLMEGGIGIEKSSWEVALGISYPFNAI